MLARWRDFKPPSTVVTTPDDINSVSTLNSSAPSIPRCLDTDGGQETPETVPISFTITAPISTQPAQPSVVAAQPSLVAAQPSIVVAAQPGVVNAQPGVVAAQPSLVAAQPSIVVAAQPGVVAMQPSVVAAQPSLVTAQPSVVVAAQPGVFSTQPSLVAAQPSILVNALPSVVAAQPAPQNLGTTPPIKELPTTPSDTTVPKPETEQEKIASKIFIMIETREQFNLLDDEADRLKAKQVKDKNEQYI